MTLITIWYPPPATPSPSGLIQGYVPRASATRQWATPGSSNSHSLANDTSTLGSPLGHNAGVEFNSITGYESLNDDSIEAAPVKKYPKYAQSNETKGGMLGGHQVHVSKPIHTHVAVTYCIFGRLSQK